MRCRMQVSNHDLVRHGRMFVEWLDRMYNPDTGQVWNGGRFAMFEPARKPVFILVDTSTMANWKGVDTTMLGQPSLTWGNFLVTLHTM